MNRTPNPDNSGRPSLLILDRMMRAGWIPKAARDSTDAVFQTTEHGLESLTTLRRLFLELGTDITGPEIFALHALVLRMVREQ